MALVTLNLDQEVADAIKAIRPGDRSRRVNAILRDDHEKLVAEALKSQF